MADFCTVGLRVAFGDHFEGGALIESAHHHVEVFDA